MHSDSAEASPFATKQHPDRDEGLLRVTNEAPHDGRRIMASLCREVGGLATDPTPDELQDETTMGCPRKATS